MIDNTLLKPTKVSPKEDKLRKRTIIEEEIILVCLDDRKVIRRVRQTVIIQE